MPFVPVPSQDRELVRAAWAILEAARVVDDPDRWPTTPEREARWLEFGWDLEPTQRFLYVPDGEDEPIGVLDLDVPSRDNLHLMVVEVTVRPDRRRRGHGTRLLTEGLRRASELGRTTVWAGTGEDDAGARAFAERLGFSYASHDARRRQVLADVDQAEVQRLHAAALPRASEYQLERLRPPFTDELLAELVEVTAAINDAPMGDLTYEDEKFDLERIQAVEAAAAGRGDRIYRVVARRRDTGEIGGHTVVVINPFFPQFGGQGDTAVSRAHRGHRLGLLLKVEMMRWLAEAEPQLTAIETWNQADNTFMISVNESIGYRLSRVFAMYERQLPAGVAAAEPALAQARA